MKTIVEHLFDFFSVCLFFLFISKVSPKITNSSTSSMFVLLMLSVKLFITLFGIRKVRFVSV